MVTHYDADNTGGGGMAPMMGGAMSAQTMTMVTTTILSVWDGDWAILEEYSFDGTSSTLAQTYVQGYHGLVKTILDNVYYYQDELGSTSHIADGAGALIESYQYDVYGKPRVYNASGVYQQNAVPVARDLFTGQRWIVEIGLYDDRNRFMSPDLGRFLQPDPIGFKGDASNLYRYCGNDWANRSDPMGLQSADQAVGKDGTELWRKEETSGMRDWAPGAMMWDFEKRADTSGGNGSRDGRADRPQAKSVDLKKMSPEQRKTVFLNELARWRREDLPDAEKFTNSLDTLIMVGTIVTPMRGEAFAESAATKAAPKIESAVNAIMKWLGKDVRAITNKAGDKIFMSSERKIRFDIKNPNGDAPHFHLEQKSSTGKWHDAGDQHRYYFQDTSPGGE